MKKALSLILALVLSVSLVPNITFQAAASEVDDAWDTDGDGVLEILAIGNSFSVDALEYAYQIAQNMGIEEIVIGNLYIGGCSLNTHATNATGDLAKYTYYYNDNGIWTSTKSYKISTALESRSWDYISMQQASSYSGVESTYNEDLTDLIAYVQARSDAKLVWHMTWAYQQDSTHKAFATYGSDQMTMYNAIVSAVQNKIVTNNAFDLIIPNGTAVQNSRTSLLGDTTTRDGYHMSKDYGRYLTGLLFIKTVTGLSVDGITYAPSGVDAQEMAIAIESVNNAYDTPFAVTTSVYAEENPCDKHLQQLPENICSGTNLWPLMEHDNEYYTVNGWGNSVKNVYSVTFQVIPGDQIWASSFCNQAVNGLSGDATRITWFDENGVLISPTRNDVYAEFTEYGYVTVPEGATAVNIPMATDADTWELYILNRDHCYENGVCSACGHTNGPVITKQPESVNVSLGEKFSFTVKAEGEGLTYQWYYSLGGDKFYASSFKSNTYRVEMVDFRIGREYYCVITDANGNSVQTDTVKAIVPVTITKQPQNVQVEIGKRAAITVQAKGEGLTYQWYYKNRNGKDFQASSYKGKTYSMTMAEFCHNRQVYCVITDKYGNTVTTEIATMSRPPMELKILTQPTDVTAPKGQKFSISFKVQGESLTYQWYYKDSYMKDFKISSFKSSSYAMTMASFHNNRQVYCVITDQYGNQVTTETVTIHVTK